MRPCGLWPGRLPSGGPPGATAWSFTFPLRATVCSSSVVTLRGPSGGHCVELHLPFRSDHWFDFRDDPPGALRGPLRGASGLGMMTTSSRPTDGANRSAQRSTHRDMMISRACYTLGILPSRLLLYPLLSTTLNTISSLYSCILSHSPHLYVLQALDLRDSIHFMSGIQNASLDEPIRTERGITSHISHHHFPPQPSHSSSPFPPFFLPSRSLLSRLSPTKRFTSNPTSTAINTIIIHSNTKPCLSLSLSRNTLAISCA